MAKKKALAVNVALLSAIAASEGGFKYVTKDEGLPLVEAGFIEVNAQMVDAENRAAARLTDAGKEYLAKANAPTAEAAAKPAYGIITNAAIPASKRGNRKGAGAPTQYPFDSMEIGHSFFVPVSAKHTDPVKQLGSTVSSANMRFSVETGETKEVERTKRGAGNKAVVGPDGANVKEKVTVKVRKQTRKFVIRSVKKDEKYGEWVAPSDGALIAREALPAEPTTA